MRRSRNAEKTDVIDDSAAAVDGNSQLVKKLIVLRRIHVAGDAQYRLRHRLEPLYSIPRFLDGPHGREVTADNDDVRRRFCYDFFRFFVGSMDVGEGENSHLGRVGTDNLRSFEN